MAAGDVTVHAKSGREIPGVRFITGEVELDGSNPTPVALGSYLSAVQGAVVSLKATAAPGDDPVAVTSGVSGTTLNVYAWKHDGSDPTLVASTNNTAVVSFVAWGKP